MLENNGRKNVVAQTIQLPNIRKLFKPDPGYVIVDADFDQADARVVAWDAKAIKLKEIFNDPSKDLHSENAITIFNRLDKRTRSLAKRGVHATNYITASSLAGILGISIREAEHFISLGSELIQRYQHGTIPLSLQSVQRALSTTPSGIAKFSTTDPTEFCRRHWLGFLNPQSQ